MATFQSIDNGRDDGVATTNFVPRHATTTIPVSNSSKKTKRPRHLDNKIAELCRFLIGIVQVALQVKKENYKL